MSDEELALWLRLHGGEVGRKNNERDRDIRERGVVIATVRDVDSTTIEAADGAKITLRRKPLAALTRNQVGHEEPYEIVEDEPPDRTRQAPPRTPTQSRSDEAAATAAEATNAERERERLEIVHNSRTPDEFGQMIPETHRERAIRVSQERVRRRQEQDANEARQRQDEAQARQQRLDQARLDQERATREATAAENAKSREATAAENALNRGLTQQQIDETRRQNEYTRNKPDFLSTADSKNPYIVAYNPQTGQIESVENKNYDAVKAAAEEKRAELASQIASRQIGLEEAKHQYTQWFDSNVRVPLMQSQEARARAEEKRQALEAEERRRQFAANFGLQKAQLGQAAGEAAAQQEISLLPYRSGPTWGADFSSAVNGLAAGGSMANNAASGIHFSESSFAFDRPDFKRIAKEAAKAALSGISNYQPSSQSFETGDYGNVPAISTGGMPAYSYGGLGAGGQAALPAPSPGASDPVY